MSAFQASRTISHMVTWASRQAHQPRLSHRGPSALAGNCPNHSAVLRFGACCLLGFWILALGVSAADAPKLTAAQTDFFESKVRPVLVDNCYKCHSAGAEKIKGGLTLDTRDGWMKGGDSGPAIVPGKPDESLFIKAIRYADRDLAMPPSDKKLPDNLIKDLEQWVRMGATDPRTEATSAKVLYAADLEKARRHWAYRPVIKTSVPVISRSVISKQSGPIEAWFRTDSLNTDSLITQNPIDAFILEKLTAKNLSPSPRADKVTLLRRATFDLHGLPPSEKEVDDFLADESPNAFEKVIDRLLASPRYGERWGRHWLDLAKYGETKGRSDNGRDMRYLWAWTYRDWVIRSLNEDLPYDQFLLRQMAADKLNLPDSREMAAMGFLTLGNRFGNNQNDIIDDRIDLIGKATMGLTLACARCHDHKFDPVPTKDYYSLHGVFSSSTEPGEGPVLEEPKDAPLFRDYQKQLAAREGAIVAFRDKVERDLGGDWRNKIGEYLVALQDFKKVTNGMSRDAYMQRLKLEPRVARAWTEYLKERSNRHHAIWTPLFAFAALKEGEYATKGRELSAKFYANADKAKPINTYIAKLFVSPPTNLGQVAARYESALLNMSKKWESEMAAYEARARAASTPPEPPKGFPDKDLEDLREILFTAKGPIYLGDQRVRAEIERDNRLRDQYNALQRAVNDVRANHPGSPARAHVLLDGGSPKDSYVMVKGNPGNRGAKVPRQAPEIITGSDRPKFKNGSGRLELAQTIASKDNPLTSRVLVNRVWLHHFGEGLVPTPDDFGVRSEAPSHPELLDYLASRFMEEGWSLKKLHKLMMLSATYQQASDDNPRFAQIDPGNKLYWQMNRRRLDFEALRDTILYIGGRLELEPMGGPGVRLDAEPYPTRRSVYAYIDRTRVPNMFQAFDFANPDLTTGKRNETVVPQQALFMMNSPLVVEQARNLTLRADFKAQTKAEDRIKLLYKLIYQRAPSEIETRLALEYIKGEYGVTTASAGAQAWEYGYGEFDPKANRMESFVQLPSFNEGRRAWTMGNRASARIGSPSLNAKGGVPGNGLPHSAVRRWTARRDGFIAIDGMFAGQGKNPGDAVRGWIVSSGTGLLGTYNPQTTQMSTKLPRVLVKRGDTIDFVVVGKGAFNWAPTVRFIEGVKAGEVTEWNAEKDFSGTAAGKQMEAWEKFAQVLLETNEMTFVN